MSRHSFVIGIAAACSIFCPLRNYLSERAHRQCVSGNFCSCNLNAWFRYWFYTHLHKVLYEIEQRQKKKHTNNVKVMLMRPFGTFTYRFSSNLGIISTHSVVLATFECDSIHIGSFQTCRRRLSTQHGAPPNTHSTCRRSSKHVMQNLIAFQFACGSRSGVRSHELRQRNL